MPLILQLLLRHPEKNPFMSYFSFAFLALLFHRLPIRVLLAPVNLN